MRTRTVRKSPRFGGQLHGTLIGRPSGPLTAPSQSPVPVHAALFNIGQAGRTHARTSGVDARREAQIRRQTRDIVVARVARR